MQMRGAGEGMSGGGADHLNDDVNDRDDRKDDDDADDDAFGFFGGPSRAVIREHIAQSFKRFDDGDKGWLNRHDLKCAFASLTGYKPSALELQHVMERCPAGQVDQRHFAGYMEERLTGGRAGAHYDASSPSLHARMEHVRRVFKAFDARHAGYVSLEDAVAAGNGHSPRLALLFLTT